jgi:hypothetical protein
MLKSLKNHTAPCDLVPTARHIRSRPLMTKVVAEVAGEKKPLSTFRCEAPGTELPSWLYATVASCFFWMIMVAWVVFARDTDIELPLGIILVLFTIIIAMMTAIGRTTRSQTARVRLSRFLVSDVQTATEVIPGSDAWIQILLIPIAIALAASAIGLVFILET